MILGHGAGAGMFHGHVQSISDALARVGIETLRYQFPYMEAGGGRTDNLANCLDTIHGALSLSTDISGDAPLLLAGHSFGGRMSSHYAAEKQPDILGLVYFSFPLHPAGKPDTKRAKHLGSITRPQLFLSGTRDKLGELELLEPTIASLKTAQLHLLDTADHSYKILKRTRVSEESVYEEAARVTAEFVAGLSNQGS